MALGLLKLYPENYPNRAVTSVSSSINFSGRPRNQLQTDLPHDEEMYAYLTYFSEVENVGLELIRSKGLKQKTRIRLAFKLFRSFVRQSRDFYQSAAALSFRTSPLFYYYSFLNLAKAYLSLTQPELVSDRIGHGLIGPSTFGSFGQQTVRVKNGVFGHLYSSLTGQAFPFGKSLNVTKLFPYIPDISHENLLVGYGKPKWTLGDVRILSNQNQKIAFPLIAIRHSHLIAPYKKFFKNFFDLFEVVNLPPGYASSAFEIHWTHVKVFEFYQSKMIYQMPADFHSTAEVIAQDLRDCFGPTCTFPTMRSTFSLQLHSPLRKNFQLPITDTLADYALMFYLGHLVRYFPSYLDSLLESKHAWIIERFSKAGGLIFLRTITNEILEQDLTYS